MTRYTDYEGLVEKLRSGGTGRVREAIRASVEKIVVSEDGSLTLAVKPEGVLRAVSGARAMTISPASDQKQVYPESL